MRKGQKGEESVLHLVALRWLCSQRVAGSHAANSVSFVGREGLPDKQGLAGGGRRGCNSKQVSFGVLLLAQLTPMPDVQRQDNLVWCGCMGLTNTNAEDYSLLHFGLQKH